LDAADRATALRIAEELQAVTPATSPQSAQATVSAAASFLRRIAGTAEHQPMTEPLVVSAMDDRWRSPYGSKGDGVLLVNAPPSGRNHVLFGPYIPLAKGNYRFELRFAAAQAGSRSVIVDLCHREGNRLLYARPCMNWEFDKGCISISCAIPEAVEDLELRLNAEGDFTASFKELVVAEQP
jgi:hypothetical protein